MWKNMQTDYPTCNNEASFQCDFSVLNIANFEFRLVPRSSSVKAVGHMQMRPDAASPWGFIKRTSIDLVVARAACRSAGFDGRAVQFGPSFSAAQASAPVYVQNFECPANASTLHDCSFDPSLFNVTVEAPVRGATEYLAVECDAVPSNERGEWELRLFADPSAKPHFGQVLFRPTPWTDWGTIDGFGIDGNVCSAICRSLGYTVENGYRDPVGAQCVANQQVTDKYPSDNSGRVWMGDVPLCGPM